MKLSSIFSLFLLSISPVGYANGPFMCGCNYLAIQAAVATGGNLGIGLVNYNNYSEVGFTVSGIINNATNSTRLFVPILFAGLRLQIYDTTYFAYGLDIGSKFGRDNGEHIKAAIQAGPYISLEQLLTPHLLLIGWINPYLYEYEKTNCQSTSTHRIFAAGGIGLSYLFS